MPHRLGTLRVLGVTAYDLQCSPSGTAQAPVTYKARAGLGSYEEESLGSSKESLAAQVRAAVQQRDLARQDASQHLQKLSKLQVAHHWWPSLMGDSLGQPAPAKPHAAISLHQAP